MGTIESIGLCNVNVGQIDEARRITEIAAVQVELSVWKDDNILNGVVDYCLAHGIPLLAYRPLGGAQRRRRLRSPTRCSPTLPRGTALSACEIALAWLTDLSASHRPGRRRTRVETVPSIARAPRPSSSTMTIARGSTSASRPAGRCVSAKDRRRRRPRRARDGRSRRSSWAFLAPARAPWPSPSSRAATRG